MKEPGISGEILVNELSVGEHYFACSVGDHCLRGMRLTVIIEEAYQNTSAQEDQVHSLASYPGPVGLGTRLVRSFASHFHHNFPSNILMIGYLI